MTTSSQNNAMRPDKLKLLSIQMSEGIKDYYPATVRVQFQGVEENFEKVLLTNILEALPMLLTIANDADMQKRLEQLCRAFQLEDWRANRDAGFFLTGKASVEWFFKTVPLLNEQQARDRTPSNGTVQLADLMQITYYKQTFYFADQFAPDGSVHPECIECWRILKASPSDTEWDRALWWTSGTGWLEGRCAPREVFKEDTQGVLDAAKQESIRDEH